MKCPKCGGTGFVPTNVFGVNGAIKCDFCDGTGVFITNAVEPVTNEEWFDNLSTEEKARFFSYEMRCEFCPNQEQCDSLGANCKILWELWLKQPHAIKG